MREPAPRVPFPFRLVLVFLPAPLREEHGLEMEQDLHLRLEEARSHGMLAIFHLWLVISADVARTILRESPETMARVWRTAITDLGTSARNLRRDPYHLAGTALILAVGIGLSTSVFSVAYSVIFRPLPYPDGDRLVMVWDQIPYQDQAFFTPEIQTDHLAGVRSSVDAFEDIGGFATGYESLIGVGDPDMVSVASVEPRLFAMLDASTVLGRLPDDEDVTAARRVAVLSSALWTSRFGSDPDVIGSRVRLGGQTLTIVGIMVPGFPFPGADPAIYLPLGLDGRERVEAIARVADGVTLPGARDRLRAFYESRDGLAAVPGPSGQGAQLPMVDLKTEQVDRVRTTLLALLGAAAFVLLIACANAASLMLVRALRRGRELSTRAALGAGRGRLARMLLGESLLVALAAGVGGTLLSVWLTGLFVRLAPGNIPRLDAVGVDLRVLLFTLAISLLTGTLTALVPLWGVSSGRLVPSLRGSGATAERAGSRIRSTLIVFEIALSVVLLSGSGLMVRTLLALQRVDLGFDSSHLLTWYLDLPADRYPDSDARAVFFDGLKEELVARAEVEGTTFTRSLPAGTSRSATWLSFPEGGSPPGFTGESGIPGFSSEPGRYTVNRVEVAGDYFEVLGLPMLAGRLPEPSAGEEPIGEVLISREMADDLWNGTDAIGQHVLLGGHPATVVGVVGDLQFGDLRLGYLPTLYTTYAQRSRSSSTYVIVRTRVAPEAFADEARRIVWGLDPELPVRRLMPLSEQVDYWLAEPRYYSMLFGIFAACALLLAVAGMYGVISYSVGQRRREIGVRMALGATRGRTLRTVLQQGIQLTVIGSILGLGAAISATRVIRSLLFGVGPTDPATLFGVVGLLLLAALLAILLPAARATRVDPAEALRVE